MDELAINGGKPVRIKAWAKWPNFEDDEIREVSEILGSGKVNYWTGAIRNVSGCKVRGYCGEFELKFSNYVGCDYAICLANGTLALELCLNALNIGVGDEVIVPSRTFIATASACVAQGVQPIFADVDLRSQCLSLDTIKDVLTENTKAIICVHLAGWSCEMDEIIEFARSKNIKVIEDCAQSLGGQYRGQFLGTFGDMAAFSFCQDKIITTGGEGGMVVTNDPDLYKRAWEYKDHGKNFHHFNKSLNHKLVEKIKIEEDGFYATVGTNFRMTEMQAAIGIKQLEKLPRWIQKRREFAEILTTGMSEIGGARVINPPKHIFHAYYKYYVFLDIEKLNDGWSREKVIKAINAEGVVCQFGSTWGIGREAGWKRVNIVDKNKVDIQMKKNLPNDYLLGRTALMFQVHPTLDEEAMNDTVKATYKVLNIACKKS